MIIILPLIPNNHYWIVANDNKQVYSSAIAAYVPVGDLDYMKWLSGPRLPTNIANEIELFDVLVSIYPAGVTGLQLPQQQADFKLAQKKDAALDTLLTSIANQKPDPIADAKGAAASVNVTPTMLQRIAAFFGMGN